MELLPKEQYLVISYQILPDERVEIEAELIRLADECGCNLVLTSGGTGLYPRDITPEATLAVADRNVPGIAEAIRANSMKYTKRAMLSRAVCVLRGQTLIVNLPGSPKAVAECLEYLLSELPHGLGILTGEEGECAR
jgi:molybdenum cofactor synthesis domain-containing protein